MILANNTMLSTDEEKEQREASVTEIRDAKTTLTEIEEEFDPFAYFSSHEVFGSLP